MVDTPHRQTHRQTDYTPLLSHSPWRINPTTKNCCSHFKLILCYFWFIISPHTKFHPNRTKNTEISNFHFWSILVGRAGRSKNGHKHITLILCCFCPIIGPHTKFHPNRTKNISQKFSLLVDFSWSGCQVEKWSQPLQTFNCRLEGY